MREKRKGTSMSDPVDEVPGLSLRGLRNFISNGNSPANDKSEGSNSNNGEVVADGSRTSANTKSFGAKFLTNEEVEESQPDQINEMDCLLNEYNALSEAVKNNMTYTEYCGLKSKGGHRGRGYDERKDIQHRLGKITIPNFDGTNELQIRKCLSSGDIDNNTTDVNLAIDDGPKVSLQRKNIIF
ncbi:hypothetical protein SUGI_0907700 [Cryptomeria japonica]|nr:hypothetical protein SUGI_0907700 [Cryptomeria japonica]